METFQEIEIEFDKFLKEQKEIQDVGGCINYVAISVWKEFLTDFFMKNYGGVYNMVKKLNEFENKK